MKRILRALLILIILVLLAGIIAALNTKRIAEWSIARTLPGRKVSIRSLVVGLRRADAKEISVTGGTISMHSDELSIGYSLRGLLSRHIENISARGVSFASANTAWRVLAPYLRVNVGDSSVGEGVVENLLVEFFGQTLADCRSVHIAFDVANLRAEQIELDRLHLKVWQDSEGVWNFERLAGLGQSALPESSAGQNGRIAPSRRAFRIDKLEVRDGQIVVGNNKRVRGLSPVAFNATLRDIDTADWSMTGDGTVRLPACDAEVMAKNGMSLHGVAADLVLKFGNATELVAAAGTASVGRVTLKGVDLDSVLMPFRATERSLQATNITAQFYGSPVEGFLAVYLNARPIGYSLGAECRDLSLEKLTAAMVPERLQAEGQSYLYVEIAGNAQEPVTWAALKFNTTKTGTVVVKNLSELLAASNMRPDQQQLFLLAFDHGELLPYKTAWLNADLFGRKLTVATFFERQTKLFFGLEVHPPPFEVPLELLKEKGWLP
jgi:hypothetical protein